MNLQDMVDKSDDLVLILVILSSCRESGSCLAGGLRLHCICVLIVVHFVLLVSCQSLFAASERPNFIFVITDDISPVDLEVYGNKSVKTPNLLRLAERGLVFDNAYLTISSCSPSRCSMITGRYPHNAGPGTAYDASDRPGHVR